VADSDRARDSVEGRQLLVVPERDRFRLRSLGRPRGDRTELPGDPQPHVDTRRSGSVGEDRCHPLEDVLDPVGPGHLFREVGEHLVRGRPFPVDEAVRHTLRTASQRLEQERDRDGGHDRQKRASTAADQRPDPGDDADVHGREGRGEEAVHERAVDDDVDLVQAVLQDRDREGRGDAEEHDDGDDVEGRGRDG
jgi:hypothetical protein